MTASCFPSVCKCIYRTQFVSVYIELIYTTNTNNRTAIPQGHYILLFATFCFLCYKIYSYAYTPTGLR